jgi:hypothetical protein
MNRTKAAKLEAAIRELTRPINGQYPRPWITSSKYPASSKVFVVGMNDAKTFPVRKVGSHDRFLDALFNRGGEDCYKLFYEVTCGPYCTRKNIDDLIRRIKKHSVTNILSTNVICYSTPRIEDLEDSSHESGVAQGRKIFRTIFEIIKPKIMIVHGKKTVGEFRFSFLAHKFPYPPAGLPSEPVEAKLAQTLVYVILGLYPQVVNRLGPSLVNKHHEDVCRVVATRLR